MKKCKTKYRVYSTIVDTVVVILSLIACFYLSGTYTFWLNLFNDSDMLIDSYELFYLFRIFIFELTLIIVYLCVIPSLTKGQTLGMYIFKIAFVNNDDSKCGFGILFLRQFIINLFIPFLSFGTSLILSLCLMYYRKDHCSLGDIVCNCKVVDKLDY